MRKFVESQIQIRATPEVILNAFLEADQLKQWWGVTQSFIQKKDGGMYILTWQTSEEGIKYISTGRIKLYDRRSHLHLEDLMYLNYEKPFLGPFTLRYTVTEQENGYTLVNIRQDGFGKSEEYDWYYKAVEDGWPEALILLKEFLEDHPL